MNHWLRNIDFKEDGPAPQLSSMAGSSGDDIPAQLAALLGKTSVRIRKTNEMPPRVSVIDVISTITGKDARHAAQEVRSRCSQYPEVDQMLVHFRFPGRGQSASGPGIEFMRDGRRQKNILT